MTDDLAFAVLDIQNAQCDEIARADPFQGSFDVSNCSMIETASETSKNGSRLPYARSCCCTLQPFHPGSCGTDLVLGFCVTTSGEVRRMR